MTGGAVDYGDLVTAATVGIDRAPLPLDALAGPAAAHQDALDAVDPAAALLDAAALLSSAARAGRPATEVRPVAPAPPDTTPELSRGASGVLYYALRGRDSDLLADLLAMAAAAGFRAAAPMLPALLDAAVRDRSIRPAACAVLGARGRWLAAHRADWQRVADSTPMRTAAPADQELADPARPGPGAPGDAPASNLDTDNPQVWQTGRRGERRDWLTALRRRAPDEARDLLAAGWAAESGAERDEFLGILWISLSRSDEPFLEAALDDRKASVRQAAARLLAALPDSAFTRRATSRGTALLRVERRGTSRALLVTLPETLDAAAVRDGIGAAPPSRAIGARAWLLTQLIAAVPLGEWTTRLGAGPDALVELPVSGGFAADVHAGWRIAAVTQRDTSWAAALLAAQPPPGDALSPAPEPPAPPALGSHVSPSPAGAPPPHRDDVRSRPPAAWPPDEELAAVLPAAAQLTRAAAMLAEHGPSQETAQALARCQGPWTQTVIDTVMRQFVRVVPATRPSRWIVVLFPLAARKLPTAGPRDYVAEIRTLAASAAQDSIAHGLRQLADVVERRRYFRQELNL
jgi:Family of unknown function (DUF5691)